MSGLLCRTHYLHGRNLAEALALFNQLKRLLSSLYPAVRENPVDMKYSAVIQMVLRKALAAGWVDQVWC